MTCDLDSIDFDQFLPLVLTFRSQIFHSWTWVSSIKINKTQHAHKHKHTHTYMLPHFEQCEFYLRLVHENFPAPAWLFICVSLCYNTKINTRNISTSWRICLCRYIIQYGFYNWTLPHNHNLPLFTTFRHSIEVCDQQFHCCIKLVICMIVYFGTTDGL